MHRQLHKNKCVYDILYIQAGSSELIVEKTGSPSNYNDRDYYANATLTEPTNDSDHYNLDLNYSGHYKT